MHDEGKLRMPLTSSRSGNISLESYNMVKQDRRKEGRRGYEVDSYIMDHYLHNRADWVCFRIYLCIISDSQVRIIYISQTNEDQDEKTYDLTA